MLITTGKSLRDLGSLDLFDAAYVLMGRSVLVTEEERKALDSVDKQISDQMFESATGMPAITQWMAPANAADLPDHLTPDPPTETGTVPWEQK